jgi:hypothetical protein
VKKHNISGRLSPITQIEPMSMLSYHNDIVIEMLRRGYNHKSAYIMPDLLYLPDHERLAKVDIELSKKDLMDRCPDCRKMIEGDVK